MADKRFHSLLRDEAPLDELQDGDGQSGHGRPEGRARRHDKVQWQRWCSRLADVESTVRNRTSRTVNPLYHQAH